MLNLEDFSKLSIEEIEKMTQSVNEELEARLKKKPNLNLNIIDKFTDIDELLRQNIHLQKELIEQMYPTGPYIELFARNERQNWKTWGNEI